MHNIGFIGAGKVGFSLGKYLAQSGEHITGYFSKSLTSAQLAADFTKTRVYTSIHELVRDNDTLFLTVPDGAIGEIWDYMRNLSIENKNICHCSGSIASTAFFDAQNKGAFAYSVHPLYAINDKLASWQNLTHAYFAIEGSAGHLDQITAIFKRAGNTVITMDTNQKALYHASAVMASNLVTSLFDLSSQMLTKCGFTKENAVQALLPLLTGNVANIAKFGTKGALTGPIERNDVQTVQNHLLAFKQNDEFMAQEIYKLLSQNLIKLAQEKYSSRDYTKLREVVNK